MHDVVGQKLVFQLGMVLVQVLQDDSKLLLTALLQGDVAVEPLATAVQQVYY